ncbi:BadF/BadG/BcrA/BcrD ATPase family protein [Cohaesibacter haloalkalitolerans]|uniref:BadF/BadG/BcrA/BcrD ATPase family protein n=1 Tax=Cohaesibacter haloalkalitolerans TaxID=1162980 RepID=UPI0013C48291|nr:BadF/BadG/BcrA/BcrD ATPase family protein [Cohaesibacter haloalkalitolerans]
MANSLYMGIDGGGSNCRGRLRDEDGTLLGEAISGPANARNGILAAQEQVAKVARETLKDAGFGAEVLGQTHVGIGLAELHISADKEAFRNWEHPFASLRVASDAHIACLGGHGNDQDGGILILGTGSCGYGLIKGQPVNVGGWGFELSDMASSAQVGIQALRFAMAALDGIYEVSPMTDHIMAMFGDSQEEMVLWASTATPPDFAGYGHVVVNFAEREDPVAMKLMADCGSQASAMLRALAWRGVNRIALMGNFAEAVEPWLEVETTTLLVPRLHDARDGAILLAGGTLPPLEPGHEQDMGYKERYGHG